MAVVGISFASVVIVGAAFIVFGLAFASKPITFARSARWVRDQPIPPSPSADQMRYYRASGIAFTFLGIVAVLFALLA